MHRGSSLHLRQRCSGNIQRAMVTLMFCVSPGIEVSVPEFTTIDEAWNFGYLTMRLFPGRVEGYKVVCMNHTEGIPAGTTIRCDGKEVEMNIIIIDEIMELHKQLGFVFDYHPDQQHSPNKMFDWLYAKTINQLIDLKNSMQQQVNAARHKSMQHDE